MQKILITGGSGFLGRKLAIKLKENNEVLLGSRNNGLNRLAENITGCRSVPLDITNIESVRDVINSFKPDVIIHAAATKYVDISEKQPLECVDINVLGSENVARVAIDHNVGLVIGVSTDKTAPPVGNIYGLSKAIMERMYCALDSASSTRFSCVRFGNIAWSTGSVFPIWKKMTEQSKCIQSTGPHMRRFFFSVDDAADLVIRSIKNIDTIGGMVLSQKMKSAQIEDLLDVWCDKYSIKWEKIPARQGDKIDEHLIGENEDVHTCEILIDNLPHFLLSFNSTFSNHVDGPFSSKEAERLTKQEMLSLISSEPEYVL